MAGNRQLSDNWLHPVSHARIACHNITWVKSSEFHCIQTASDLYFDQIPITGTMPHAHDFLEMLLVSMGGLLHGVNGERQHLTAGDVCFLRPDDVHCFLPDGTFEQVEIVMLDYGLELALALSTFLGDDEFLHRMTASVLPSCFKLDIAATTSLYERLIKLNTPANTAHLRGIKVKILLGELYARFFVDDCSLLMESRVPRWLETLCAAMRKQENFLGGVKRMQQLSRRSPGHLCKVFRQNLHKTPTEFINELRINHAAWMLADTDEEIVAIADALNFQSLSRFYHLFRQTYGVSPAAYRRLHLNNRQV